VLIKDKAYAINLVWKRYCVGQRTVDLMVHYGLRSARHYWVKLSSLPA